MPARRVVALTRAAIAVRLVADVFVLAVLGEATAVAVEVLADVAGTGVTAARTAILATIGGGGAVAAEGDSAAFAAALLCEFAFELVPL